MLNKEIIDFTKRAIKVRLILIENKVSKLPETEVKQNLQNIQKLIEAYGYTTDEKAALFLIKHYEEISSFLPGVTSLAHKAFQMKLDDLVNRSKKVIDNAYSKAC